MPYFRGLENSNKPETRICSLYNGKTCKAENCNVTCKYPQKAICFNTFLVRNGSQHLLEKVCIDDGSGYKNCANECVVNISYEDSREIFSCCCHGDMCNKQSIFPIPKSYQYPTQLSSMLTDQHEKSGPSNLTVFGSSAGIVASLIALSVVTLILFWCWSNRDRGQRLGCNLCNNVENGRHMEISRSNSPHPTMDLTSLNVIDKIGSGRFSEVWKGHLNDNLVAIKIFQEKEKQSWKTERDMYTNPEIQHANLRCFVAAERRVVKDNMEYWIVLEYHKLGSLNDYLKANVVTCKEMCQMAASIAAGLAYLHSEIQSDNGVKPTIAHRDIKSRNVLVKRDLSCCICDLGLGVKFQPGTSLTESQGQVGTIRYMAPEVLEGAITFNRESILRIDVYALGLVIWEIISRCSFGGTVSDYKQPFEEEVGLRPKVHQMTEVVVHSRKRPRFPNGLDCMQPLEFLVETVEECWDHEPEARLTAQCVEERAKSYFNATMDHQTGTASRKYERSSRLKPSTETEHIQVPIDQEGHQRSEEGNDLAEISTKCLQPQKSQGITEQKPFGVEPDKPLFYPQDSSCSPPPYSPQHPLKALMNQS